MSKMQYSDVKSKLSKSLSDVEQNNIHSPVSKSN